MTAVKEGEGLESVFKQPKAPGGGLTVLPHRARAEEEGKDLVQRNEAAAPGGAGESCVHGMSSSGKGQEGAARKSYKQRRRSSSKGTLRTVSVHVYYIHTNQVHT